MGAPIGNDNAKGPHKPFSRGKKSGLKTKRYRAKRTKFGGTVHWVTLKGGIRHKVFTPRKD